MADLTRERLAELRAEFAGVLKLTGKPDERLSVSLEEGIALLSMASRCVSIETLRKLTVSLEHLESMKGAATGEKHAELNRARESALYWFCIDAQRDLKEAAESLAKEGE
jgi:hypothetical protein